MFTGFLTAMDVIRLSLQDLLVSLQKDLSVREFEKSQNDFKEIGVALEKLGGLLSFLQSETTNTTDAQEKWSHYRHDVRSFIGAVRGYSELILEEHEKTLQMEARNSLQKIINDCNEMLIQADKLIVNPHRSVSESEDYNIYSPYPSKILIVDDSPAKRELLARRLIPSGHTVLLAESGVEALAILSRESVDLILLDLVMPGLNGLEVLKRIKGNPETRDLPVLVISSQSELESVVACIRIGADDYLPMPVSPVLLHARINACLNKKHLLYRERAHSAELIALQQHLKTAIESIEDGFCIFDADDRLTVWNQRFQDLYPPFGDLETGMTYAGLIKLLIEHDFIQMERRTSKNQRNQLNPNSLEDWSVREIQLHQDHTSPRQWYLNDGRWIEIHEHALPNGGVVAVHKDITSRKAHEEHMNFLANNDGLTGLANRNAFNDYLTSACKRFQNDGTGFALLFLDLDGFKGINDTFGHDVGDQLLKYVAKQLRSSVRDSDTVARIGGDEFVVLIEGLNTKEDVNPIATRILEAVRDQITFQGQTLNYGCSIGIAFCPDHGTSPEELMLIADETMYKAKHAGKGRFIYAGNKLKSIS